MSQFLDCHSAHHFGAVLSSKIEALLVISRGWHVITTKNHHGPDMGSPTSRFLEIAEIPVSAGDNKPLLPLNSQSCPKGIVGLEQFLTIPEQGHQECAAPF